MYKPEAIVVDEVFDPPSTKPRRGSALAPARQTSRTLQRRLNQSHGRNLIRVVDANCEARVAETKIKESTAVIDTGMADLAVLSDKAAFRAGGDPILYDRLMTSYIDLAQMGHTTIIANLFDQYGRR